MTASFGRALSDLTGPQRLCVGVDPHAETLTQWGLANDASGVGEFAAQMLDQMVEAGVRITKPQVALFEQHGLEGMRILAQFMAEARAKALLVIADVKRGDIGTSLQGYADAWLLPGSDFEADAMTAVAYQGVGSLEPAFEVAAEHGKGVFVLAATSNPEGRGIQGSKDSRGVSVATQITTDVRARARRTPHGESGWLGLVVGATVDWASVGLEQNDFGDLSLLAPGFGAQGVRLSDAPTIFQGVYQRTLPAVSRSVAGSSPDGLADRIRAHQHQLSGSLS